MTKQQRGFTLLEIIIAIGILAVGISTIMGIQTGNLTTVLRDHERQHALLAAEEIMSFIDKANSDELVDGTKEGLASDILSQVVIGQPAPRLPPAAMGLTARLIVEPWPIPGVPPDLLRRVTLTVRWGEAPRDEVTLVSLKAVDI